jgi:serine protease Do
MPSRRLALVLAAVAACLALTPAGDARAQSALKQVPTSQAQIELSYASVVKRAAPAVVNIYSRRVVREVRRSPMFDDPFFQRFFGQGLDMGVPRERVQSSLGSGVIVRADGVIVTNNHVIKEAQQITVALADRREFEARVLVADERTDLAVLRIDTRGEQLPMLGFEDSDQVEVGDLVLAIGNPFGVGQTVTSGIVSALARTRVGISDYQFFIQTDAAINPGNSGGALVGLDGRLVGINTAIYSRDGGSNGIGFAIPANMVKSVVDAALSGGKIVRPWLGATGQAVTAEIAGGLGLDRPAGVLIDEVYPGGPADRAGLRVGDVVLAVDGKEIFDPEALNFRIATLGVGQVARLSVLQKGVRKEVSLPLSPAPEAPKRNISRIDGANPLSGATVGNLSPAFADELGVDLMARGVIVLETADGSPSERVGLRPGDIVAAINGERIDNVDSLVEILNRGSGNWRLTIRRRDQTLNVVVRG